MAEPTEEGFAQVKKQVLKIGEPSTLGLAVEEGLKGGELVVVAGLSSLQDGMKVRLLKKDQPKYAEARIEALAGSDEIEPIDEDPEVDEPQDIKPGDEKAGKAKP